MKTRIQSLSFLATLAVVLGMISWGSALTAQTAPSTPTDQQQTPQQQPMPNNPPADQTPKAQQPEVPPSAQQPPSAQTPDQAQAPSSNAQTPAATDSQSFTGTVVKTGDKYMLKDDAGHTYDIDHQDDVKKFEGKRVKVQGTLDATGTKIQVK